MTGNKKSVTSLGKNNGASKKDYRKAELNLIKEDNRELKIEKDKLISMNNDLAYQTEVLSSSVASKEKEKEFLFAKLKRKQQELKNLKTRSTAQNVGGLMAAKGKDHYRELAFKKEVELQKYKDKYERMLKEYSDFNNGKDKFGKEKKPFYEPSPAIKSTLGIKTSSKLDEYS